MPPPPLAGLTGPAVQIKINNHIFTVNEDVLCAHSTAFRELLQCNRKEVADCPICTEPIFSTERVVWCKGQCGQNMHASCVEEWGKRSKNCAYCRGAWQTEDSRGLKLYVVEHDQEPSTVMKDLALEDVAGVYLHYLYTNDLNLDEFEKLRQDARYNDAVVFLYRLLFLGDVLRDPRFKTDVLNQLFFKSEGLYVDFPKLDMDEGFVRAHSRLSFVNTIGEFIRYSKNVIRFYTTGGPGKLDVGTARLSDLQSGYFKELGPGFIENYGQEKFEMDWVEIYATDIIKEEAKGFRIRPVNTQSGE
jgi:hypothetical protein